MPTRTIAQRTARVPMAVIAMKSMTTCSMPRACRMERITAAVIMAGLGVDMAGFLTSKLKSPPYERRVGWGTFVTLFIYWAGVAVGVDSAWTSGWTGLVCTVCRI